MTESDGDSLVNLIYGTLPIADAPRAECDARDGAASGRVNWVSAKTTGVTIHTIIKLNGIPRHSAWSCKAELWNRRPAYTWLHYECSLS